MSGKVLGLDIGSEYASAVILTSSIKGPALVECCRIKHGLTPWQVSDSHDGEGSVPMEKLVNELASRMDLSSCSSTAITLPGSWFFFRHIQLPLKNPGKIRQILSMELPSHLPLSNETSLFDFLLTSQGYNEGLNDVLTVSIREDFVRDIFAHLASLSLRPSLIAPRGYLSGAFYLKNTPSDLPICFVDSDSASLTLSLAVKGSIVHIRSLTPASDTMGLITAMERTFDGFSLSHGLEFVPELCLINDGSGGDSFSIKTITDNFGCPVEFLDFSNKLKAGQEGDCSQNALGAAFATTGGGNFLNLCRNDYAAYSFVKAHGTAFMGILILCLAVFVSLIFDLHVDMSVYRKQAADMDEAARRIYSDLFPSEKKIVDPLMQLEIKVRDAGEKSDVPSLTQGSGAKMTDLLHEISSTIPKEIDIVTTRLVINPERIIFSGNTDNFNNVDRIKGGLEKSVLFKEVKISNASADKNGGRVRFQFMIQLNRESRV